MKGTSISAPAARPQLDERATGSRILGITLITGLLAGSCSLDESPHAVQVVEVVAPRVGALVIQPDGSVAERRALVDGNATDTEWGTAALQLLAMDPAMGSGGGTFIAIIKAVHDGGRVYFLLQWPDTFADRFGPFFIFEPDSALATGCDPQLVGCNWRILPFDEDRASLMFDMGDARDNRGTFRELGCQVACHGNMHPTQGSVDVWQWRAARTNPIQLLLSGGRRVGFADDGFADAGGREPDAGVAFFRDNIRLVECADGSLSPVPLEVPLALDADGQPAIDVNGFMRPCEHISDQSARAFDQCTNRNPCRQFEQEAVEAWVAGDLLPATLLTNPAGSRQSRHDVEARGRWDDGTWTLELSRPLTTGNADDVQFDLTSSDTYAFSLAIMNNSGAVHSGSPVIRLRFAE